MQLSISGSVHCAVAYREKKNNLIVKSSLRHLLQVPNLFIAPLPTTAFSKLKAANRAVCAVGN